MLPEIPRIGHPVLDGIIQAVVSVGAVLFSLLIVWLKWGAPQWERLNSKVRSIKEQTNNSHETNLRDDLDKVLEQVEQVSAALTQMQGDTSTACRAWGNNWIPSPRTLLQLAPSTPIFGETLAGCGRRYGMRVSAMMPARTELLPSKHWVAHILPAL